MLDVAIGLALVIAMLSLLVTAINEAMAGMRNSRGRNLARLVCSLVGDNKSLSEDILAHPFLESMMMEKTSGQRSPSYLSSDVFVTGLLGFLTQYTGGIRPSTPAVLIAELKSKLPQDGQQRFVTSMSTLLPGAEADWPTFEKRLQAWFDAVAERSSGWYKRSNQLWLFSIGLVLAFAMNINPIVITKALWNDAGLRKFAVAQAEVALQAYQAQTGTPLAATGTVRAASSLSVPERYRQATDMAVTTIHFLLRDQTLASDEVLRTGDQEIALAAPRAQQMRDLLAVERATAGVEGKRTQYTEAYAGFNLRLEQLRRLVVAAPQSGKTCGSKNQLDCAVLEQLGQAIADLSKAIKSERGIHDALSGDKAAAALLRQQCESLSADAPGTAALCAQLKQLGIFSSSSIPIGWGDDTWPATFGNCKDNPKAKTPESPKPDLKSPGCTAWAMDSAADAGNWGTALAGWLLTAMAATLGAPFWFDLLGKLVKLRSSGVKPSESSGTGPAGNAPNNASPSTLTPAPVQTDGSTAPRTASRDALNDAEHLLTEDEITRIQRNLDMAASEHSGRIDLRTRQAIAAWQTRYGALSTGELTQAQISELLTNSTLMKDDGYVG
jgi:hypothetical protein